MASNREEYIEKMEAKMKELNARIDLMEAKAQN